MNLLRRVQASRSVVVTAVSSLIAASACVSACSSADDDHVGTTSSTASSGATGGMGGAGGDTVDHGAPSDVYPAFHPTMPAVVNGGQPVMASPVIVPVYFSGVDPSIQTGLTTFTSSLGATDYWSRATAEYGVGPATAATPITLAEAPSAATLDDADVQSWLAAKLNTDDQAFPPADENTLFVLVYPPGTTITIDGAASCKDLGAYHNSVTLDDAHGKLAVAYAVIPECGTFHGLSGIDEVSVATSHEVIEAVTDPSPLADLYGYGSLDTDHLVWAFFSGAEVCDLCDASPASYGKLPGFDFAVERCWSNAAASMLHDPCVPADETKPYFNAAPVLPDTVHVSGLSFPGVIAAVGETHDVELDLFSDGPTSGPWTVSVKDLGPLFGLSKELDVTLDRTSGVNGEKLHVSLTPIKKAPQFSLFLIESKLGNQVATWVVPVTNQ